MSKWQRCHKPKWVRISSFQELKNRYYKGKHYIYNLKWVMKIDNPAHPVQGETHAEERWFRKKKETLNGTS